MCVLALVGFAFLDTGNSAFVLAAGVRLVKNEWFLSLNGIGSAVLNLHRVVYLLRRELCGMMNLMELNLVLVVEVIKEFMMF